MGSQIVVFIGAIFTGFLFIVLQVSDSNIFSIGTGQAPFEGSSWYNI